MSFSQFDLSKIGRCLETNEEGFSCRREPNHREAHLWDRCEWTDERGVPCMLPHRHPGRHVLFWYDEPATAGSRKTLEFSGTEQSAAALGDRAARLAARRGWVEVERQYVPGVAWRVAPLAALLRLVTDPQGSVRITFRRVGGSAGAE